MKRSNRPAAITVISVTFICLLTLLASSSCGVVRDILPPAFDNWASGPYKAYASIVAPSSARQGQSFTITAVVQFGSRAEMITDKDIEIDAAAHKVNISIIARMRSGIFTCDVPEPIFLSFPVTMDAVGEWTIACKNDSSKVVVYGDWLGEEREANAVDFLLPKWVFANKETQVRVVTGHEDGTYVFSRLALDTDTENKIMRLRVYERPADTGLSGGAWRESTVSTVVFPSEGVWLLVIGADMIAERMVNSEVNYFEEPDYWYIARGMTPNESCPPGAALPVSFAVPDGALAGVALDCPYTAIIKKGGVFRSCGADYYFDEGQNTISAFLYANWYLVNPGDEDAVSAYSSTRLIFPTTGDWTVSFHRSDGATFQANVTIPE